LNWPKTQVNIIDEDSPKAGASPEQPGGFTIIQVWLWFHSKKLHFPLQTNTLPEIQRVTASYHAIHSVLTNPVYAGVYAYGKTRILRR
jgi:hypothetical protein